MMCLVYVCVYIYTYTYYGNTVCLVYLVALVHAGVQVWPLG